METSGRGRIRCPLSATPPSWGRHPQALRGATAWLSPDTAGPGVILAEASVLADRSHCEGEAVEDSVVHLVPMRRLRAALTKEPALARAWTHRLALEVQRARAHAEILSLKTVSAGRRLDDAERCSATAKGQWRQVAAEIGVTPAA